MLLEEQLRPYCVCAAAAGVITRVIMPLVSQQQMPLKVLPLPLLLFSRSISSSVPFSSCAPFSRCVCLAGLVRVAGQGRGPKFEKSTFPLGGIRLGGIVAPIRVARGKVSCKWPRLKHLKKRDITVSTKNSWKRAIFPLFPLFRVFPDFLSAPLMAHQLRHGLSHHLTPLNSRIDISNRVLKMFLRYFPRLCVQRWWHCCAPFLQKAQEEGLTMETLPFVGRWPSIIWLIVTLLASPSSCQRVRKKP